MLHPSLRKLWQPLRRTPLHPQWLLFRHEQGNLRRIGAQVGGAVLDLGCGHRRVAGYLSDPRGYLGLDSLESGAAWYASRPDLFGDAHSVPIRSGSMDHVLLLDVLEHLRDPDACLREVYRVLKPGGTVTLQVPFLYPLHDEPLDFRRWTLHGLRHLARSHGFRVLEEEPLNGAVASAALLLNLALSQVVLDAWRRRSPAALGVLLLPFACIGLNTLGWLLGALGRHQGFMPSSYRVRWSRPEV